MKSLFLFITILCSIQVGKAQVRVEYISEEPKLKGHIKQIVEYGYVNPRNIDSLKNPHKIVKDFDEKGHQIDELDYNKLGDLESKIVFDNSKANIVLQSLYDNNGKLILKIISKYDDEGHELESGSFSDSTTSVVPDYARFKFIYKYDGQNDMIETDTYTGNSLTSKEVYTYNERHQLIQKDIAEYLGNRVSKAKTVFQYQINGNKVIDKRYTLDGKLISEHIVIYSDVDSEGNWLTDIAETKNYNINPSNYSLKDVIKRQITYFK